MVSTTRRYRRRRVITPFGTVPALKSRDLLERTGWCYTPSDHPGENANLEAMLDDLSWGGQAGFRQGVMRLGRVQTAGNGVDQRAAVASVVARGMKIIAIIDDYGSGTHASRAQEIATNWPCTLADLLCVENLNEAQRQNDPTGKPGVNTNPVASWTYNNGVPYVDNYQGNCHSVDDAIEQHVRMKAACNTHLPGVKILAGSFATRNQTGWYDRQNARCIVNTGNPMSFYTDYNNVHEYAGANPPSDQDFPKRQREAANAAYGTRLSIMTETGYHDDLTYTGSHKPINEQGAATYYPRLWFEGLYDSGFDYVTAYHLNDTPAQTAAHERHFGGAYYSNGSKKPAGIANKNLFGLYGDTNTAWNSPASMSANIQSPSSLSYVLHQKSNGAYLLAIWQPGASVWDRDAKVNLTPPNQTFTIEWPTTKTVKRYVPRLNAPGSPASTTTGALSYTTSVGGDLVVLEIT